MTGKRTPAGTWYEGKDGKPHPCMTENGKPCSKHAKNQHIGNSYEEAEQAIQAKYNADMNSMGTGLTSEQTAMLTSILNDAKHDSNDRIESILGEPVEHIGSIPVYEDKHASPDGVAALYYPHVKDGTVHVDSLRSIADDASMNDDESHGVRQYTGYGAYDMNRVLRGDEMMDHSPDEQGGVVHDLNSLTDLLDRTESPDDMIVYRQERFMEGDSPEYKAIVNACNENNDDMYDKHDFTSTTINGGNRRGMEESTGCVDYVIMIPKGTHGMLVDSQSYHADEQEFLVQQGQSYKVKAIVNRGSGYRLNQRKPIVIMEAVPAESHPVRINEDDYGFDVSMMMEEDDVDAMMSEDIISDSFFEGLLDY